MVADLVFSDVPGRVAKQLLELAKRFGDRRDDGIHVHHDLTQEELAQLVGASRETVNKALADFAARGWIRLEPRSVTILDVERVRAPRPADASPAPRPEPVDPVRPTRPLSVSRACATDALCGSAVTARGVARHVVTGVTRG